MIGEEVAVEHQAKVAAILHTEKGVGAAARQIGHTLRVNIDEFHLRWR